MSGQTLRCLGCDRTYADLASAVKHRGETGHTVVRER